MMKSQQTSINQFYPRTRTKPSSTTTKRKKKPVSKTSQSSSKISAFCFKPVAKRGPRSSITTKRKKKPKSKTSQSSSKISAFFKPVAKKKRSDQGKTRRDEQEDHLPLLLDYQVVQHCSNHHNH